MKPKKSEDTKLSSGGESELGVNLLVEVLSVTVSSAEELSQDWEDIEFLVDSGASAFVVGNDMVKAVESTDPNPNANHHLADGSTIPNKGV